jgi:hypothetical protein
MAPVKEIVPFLTIDGFKMLSLVTDISGEGCCQSPAGTPQTGSRGPLVLVVHVRSATLGPELAGRKVKLGLEFGRVPDAGLWFCPLRAKSAATRSERAVGERSSVVFDTSFAFPWHAFQEREVDISLSAPSSVALGGLRARAPHARGTLKLPPLCDAEGFLTGPVGVEVPLEVRDLGPPAAARVLLSVEYLFRRKVRPVNMSDLLPNAKVPLAGLLPKPLRDGVPGGSEKADTEVRRRAPPLVILGRCLDSKHPAVSQHFGHHSGKEE